jgi:ADP-heptose:LPS heptosyltransferase
VIRRNVLVFHSGGLGDFVLTWPLGLALGRLHPQSRIIYVTQASKGALAAAALGLDWRDAESSWPALYSDPAGLNEKARQTVAEAHSVYTFISGAQDAFCGNVASLADQATIIPLRLAPPPEFGGHVSEHLVQQLVPFPAVRSAVEQILASIRNNGLSGSRRSQKQGDILIHPGSGGRAKCWPINGFLQLIERLVKAGNPVKVLLGEVELERFSADDLRRLETAAAVAKPANYVDLYAQCAAAAGFIGHDSGPAHLAGIMGLPTLALFGPSDPAVWRPLGPRVKVLHQPNLEALEAQDVVLAWKSMMELD